MKRLALALLITSFATGSPVAQSCATKALSKDGKPLAGAGKGQLLQEVLRGCGREQGRKAAVRRSEDQLREEVREWRLSITALAIKAWPARPYRRFAARGSLSGSGRA
jgi:hypothetical protein